MKIISKVPAGILKLATETTATSNAASTAYVEQTEGRVVQLPPPFC